jgi:nitrogen fixation protein NifU and related proteins
MPGLDDLYREIILDHYRTPRNRGTLDVPPAVVQEGHNPLCGDEIQVYLVVGDGVVDDIRISGQGCSISQSSASMMTTAVKGRTIDEARAVIHRFLGMLGVAETDESEAGDPEVKLGDLEALQGVVKFPVRIKCATLAWHTLEGALEQAVD